MKYDCCDECKFFTENFPAICSSCDDGDQFMPAEEWDEDACPMDAPYSFHRIVEIA